MWDVHTRIGGFAGSNLQTAQCEKTPDTVITLENLKQDCIAAYMAMHVTKSATGLYMEITGSGLQTTTSTMRGTITPSSPSTPVEVCTSRASKVDYGCK